MTIPEFYNVVNKFHAQRVKALALEITFDSWHDSADMVTYFFFGIVTPRNYTGNTVTNFNSVYLIYDFFNNLDDPDQIILHNLILGLDFPTLHFAYLQLQNTLNLDNDIPNVTPATPAEQLNLSPNEIPYGAVDGVNTVFRLAYTPSPNCFLVFLNGTLLNIGIDNDFTFSGNIITFNYAPGITDILRVTYFY